MSIVDAVVAAEYCGKSGKNRRRVHPLLRSSASALRMEGVPYRIPMAT